ncbi:sugar phosphate isomerase/epimerase [Cohaesibacter sp. CAU 1516]|uniref:sugar phosphate isomerase/epimerase family protein n=1 Tax=Cohaesibacter sp. CAU 1516 TaxID=2576038 RepID=UPI0010FDAB06|nr:TIM barrel protein [Cohaesibacter sp. CAU 1516]TLP48514.1 sugar phosphate isomerase/epimerase [Cohaesibacter sp. CAU 1516]
MIGFIQGRLVPQVNGMIQAFPWEDWQKEMALADSIGIHCMEWTLDQADLYDNPLMTEQGQAEIRALCDKHHLTIPNLTGDCFMQAPFWKAESAAKKTALLADFEAICRAASTVGIRNIVVPLVDNGSLQTETQTACLIDALLARKALFDSLGIAILFESDLAPQPLASFIAKLPAPTFGINYDSGNSAGIGYDVRQEWAAYGERIVNLHIKDRLYQGTTVPLGTGAADFPSLFACMAEAKYSGDIILQTARAADGDHLRAILAYRAFVKDGLKQAGGTYD